jgi:hypothetical protein
MYLVNTRIIFFFFYEHIESVHGGGKVGAFDSNKACA